MAKQLTDAQWKKRLTPEQYEILREKGTEAPFTGKFLGKYDSGTYICAACGAKLFASKHKFDSKTGWPSFYDVLSSDVVKLHEDHSQGMERVEAVCTNCGGHLGHVFHDAPDQPTGMRFCINSCALDFSPEANAKRK